MMTDTSRPSGWARLWNSLTAPSSAIQEIGERRQSQLAATIGLMFTFLNAAGLIATAIDTSMESALISFSGSVIASLIGYAFGRTRYYPLGTFFIAGGLILSEILTIQSRPIDQPFDATFLTFSVLSIVIGSVSLSWWASLILLAANLGALFYLVATGHVLETNVGGVGGAFFSIGVLLIVFNIFRNRVERERLSELRQANQKLEAIQFSLEERVEERTIELDRRSVQLEAAAFIARQAAAIQEMGQLLNETVRLISDRFGYYHAGVFLTDEANRTVILRATSSEGGLRMLARGHRLEIGREGIVGYAAYQKQPRIAHEVGTEAVFFNNPDLPQTRSEIALPLVVKNKLIGVLDIQSTEPNAFQQADIYALQTMADQIALAIENTRLITDSQLAIQQLQGLTSTSTSKSWQERLGLNSKGYVYTPMGTSLLQDNRSTDKVVDAHAVDVPIMLRGQRIGAIRLTRQGTHAFWSEKEKDLTNDIATQVGLALENARLLEEAQKRAIREQTINDITARLNRALDVDSLLQTAAREFHQLPNVAEVSVYINPADELSDPKPGERK